jgi:hypothetical protein
MDRRFLPADDVFFLKIRGDSMQGRGMLDGDYVMVRPASKARAMATSSRRGWRGAHREDDSTSR